MCVGCVVLSKFMANITLGIVSGNQCESNLSKSQCLQKILTEPIWGIKGTRRSLLSCISCILKEIGFICCQQPLSYKLSTQTPI